MAYQYPSKHSELKKGRQEDTFVYNVNAYIFDTI